MPINLEFIDDRRVLKMNIVSPWNLQELGEVLKSAHQILAGSSSRIDAIADVTRMGSVPAGALRLRNSAFLSHPHGGYQIVVGVSPYAIPISEILFRLTRVNRVRFYETTDEALAFLRSTKEQPELEDMNLAE